MPEAETTTPQPVYVRTPAGAVHSLIPGADVPEGFTAITEDEARAENPQLFGAPDPAVTFCELRDNA